MKQSVSIKMTRRIIEADSYIKGCENNQNDQSDLVGEILYWLLVVEDRNEKGKWRKIGFIMAPVVYIQKYERMEKGDIVLI
jgi:hypothetical protein